jgi:hypothetical protein
LNIKAPQPVGVHFHHLLEHLNIQLVFIISCILSLFLSWSLINPVCNFQLIKHMRGETSALIYHQLFTKFTSTYQHCMVVYTESLFVQGSTGCAFVYEDQVFSYHLQ